MLFDKVNQHANEIREAGPNAIKVAKAAGVAVYYADDSLGDGLIKEMPDGTRYRVKIENGEDIVLDSFTPKA
jgi:predicted Fe-Mo cluster-binding NifX family protein